MKAIKLNLNECTTTETNEPLDITEKQSDQYGEGKVKYFEPDAFINTDDIALTSRYIKRYGDKND